MSEIKVKELLSTYREANSISGPTISKTELKGLWLAAQDVEPGQTPDKPLTAGEADVFTSLTPKDVISYARPLLAEYQATVAQLLQEANVAPVPAKRGNAVFVTASQGFAINAEGTLPSNPKHLAKALFGAGRWLQASFGSGDNLYVKAALTAPGKRAVLEQFKTAQQADLSSLTEPQRQQLLGSMAALTLELVKSIEQLPMIPQADTQALHNEAFDTLLGLLDDARLSPLAKRSLVGYAKDSNSFLAKLSAAQKTNINVRHDILFPKAPAGYAAWDADNKSTIVIDHVCGQGENFVFGFVEQLLQDGIGNNSGRPGSLKFKLASGDATVGPAVLRVTVPASSSQNKWGREMTVEVRVREYNTDMYKGMGNPSVDVVSYGGHANFGNNTLESLAVAPKQQGAKIIARDLCCGADTKAKEAQAYPEGAINSITSISSSYFRLKEHPELGEYANESEGYSMLMSLARGLLGKRGWDAVGQDLGKVANWAGHDSANNWTWATDPRAGSFFDDDADGIPNVFDLLPNYDTTDVAASTQREFELKAPGIAADEISGARAFQAIQFLNTATNYNSFLQPLNKQRMVHPHPEGVWFEASESPDTYARFAKSTDGKYHVQLNSALSNMTEESMRAVVYVEFVRFLAGLYPTKFSGVAERNAQALIFAMSSIQYDGSYRDQPVFAGLKKLYKLPAAATFAAVQAELKKADEERHNYTGDRQAALALLDKVGESLAAAQVMQPAVLVS